MPYDIDIWRDPDKFLQKLSRQQPGDLRAIEDAFDELAEDPRRPGAIQLKGRPGIWRYRVGDYRICYQIDDGTLIVLVVTISTRADVYAVVSRALGKK